VAYHRWDELETLAAKLMGEPVRGNGHG